MEKQFPISIVLIAATMLTVYVANVNFELTMAMALHRNCQKA
jgi:hypothetical protein